MAFTDELQALKAQLKAAGVPVDEVLALAEVNRSTWTRWGQGQTPRLDRWEAVKAAAASKLSTQDHAA